MGLATKIRLLLVKQGNISEAELARRLGQSPQNFYYKMKRDNFSEAYLREIAEVLGNTLEITFIDKVTGDKT
jgi:transcriptional regulator with XRE-family HTH domain